MSLSPSLAWAVLRVHSEADWPSLATQSSQGPPGLLPCACVENLNINVPIHYTQYNRFLSNREILWTHLHINSLIVHFELRKTKDIKTLFKSMILSSDKNDKSHYRISSYFMTVT